MNEEKAKRIISEFFRNEIQDEDEIISYIHALEYLIQQTNQVEYILQLGSYYYANRDFQKALLLYEQASMQHSSIANENLGYLYYYGRLGKPDYQKAYHYYSLALEEGSLVAAYKIADMYHYGYYVEKNEDIYKGMIKALYSKLRNANHLEDPVPEVFSRLANIYKEEGNIKSALQLIDFSIRFLTQRIAYNPFFGNLTIMKHLILDQYKIIDFNEEDFQLFDLYYLVRRDCIIHFTYLDEIYEIEISRKNDQLRIEFNNQYYSNIDDFFANASIEHQQLIMISRYLTDFELLE